MCHGSKASQPRSQTLIPRLMGSASIPNLPGQQLLQLPTLVPQTQVGGAEARLLGVLTPGAGFP